MLFFYLLVMLQSLDNVDSLTNLVREANGKKYSNSWAVQIHSHATEADVNIVAEKYGLKLLKIFKDYYLLIDESSNEPSTKPRISMINSLLSEAKLKWVEQQTLEEYSLRDFSFNDPQWTKGKQWYLKKEAFSRVESVWNKGITGKGITIAVIDDGVRGTHHEFIGRYDTTSSLDLVDGENPKNPTSILSHGTQCAGVISAAGGNGLCGVGVAFQSNITGIRLLKTVLATDAHEAKAFYPGDSLVNKIDIFSNSWGPKDDGATIRGPKMLAQKALIEGTTKGRNGRGFIYVFSAGNGGPPVGDSCSFDGYANSIYTIAVSSVDKNGKVSLSTEPCSAIMTSVYSGDMTTASISSDTSCNGNFGGTSAAAAFTSGIIALALQANGNLTWRDIQHLIVRSSKPESFDDAKAKWITNGAGFNVSERLGFGVLDALLLVNKAQTWNQSVVDQKRCEVPAARSNVVIGNSPSEEFVEVDVDVCKEGVIRYLEHVQLRVNLVYTRRGVIAIDVISPTGTKSRMIHARGFDAIIVGNKKFTNLVTTSVHFWGEPSEGQWSVRVENQLPATFPGNGTLIDFSLILYGTYDPPPVNHATDEPPNTGTTHKPDDDKTLAGWIIAVIVIGAFIVVGAVVAIVVYCFCAATVAASFRRPTRSGVVI